MAFNVFAMNAPTALILLHEGLEEMEAIAPIDILRRAGASVCTASLNKEKTVRGRSKVALQADVLFEEIKERLFDALVIPGGPGTMALRNDPRVLQAIRTHAANGKCVAAICAAPVLLIDAGVLGECKRTCHISMAQECAPISDLPVVEDGAFITSRGAGTAAAFALTIAARLCGAPKANEVAQSIHFE